MFLRRPTYCMHFFVTIVNIYGWSDRRWGALTIFVVRFFQILTLKQWYLPRMMPDVSFDCIDRCDWLSEVTWKKESLKLSDFWVSYNKNTAATQQSNTTLLLLIVVLLQFVCCNSLKNCSIWVILFFMWPTIASGSVRCSRRWDVSYHPGEISSSQSRFSKKTKQCSKPTKKALASQLIHHK